MEDPRLKKHLGLARDAGTKAMAKDFFADVPGAGGPAEGEAAAPVDAAGEGGESPALEQLEQLSPEQLEELLALLQQQGGGEAPPEGV